MKQSDTATVRNLYLDLLKRALTNWIHGHEEFVSAAPNGLSKLIAKMVFPAGTMLVTPQRFDEQKRENGQDWPVPLLAHTMVGLKRLDNLQMCIENVITDAVPGDLIETGVWKGGSTIFMRGALKAYGDSSRRIWVADSFQGLPPPNPKKYPADDGDIHHTIETLSVTEEMVRQNFAAYGLLDDKIMFLKGWFRDTLPTAPIEHLAVIRLDGDMYESTMDALQNLYMKLSFGGYVIVDDYCIESCRKAITDFRIANDIKDAIIDIDGTGAFWRRGA
jgi:Macrocin-O-methyltransferase (TylF)